MNIDYTEIITKANARKDALQALGAALTHAEGRAADLFDAIGYFAELEPLIKAIDDEGKNMLKHIPARVLAVANLCINLRRSLAQTPAESWVSMPGLLDAIRTPGAPE